LIAAFKPKLFVEVGVAYGYHANHILVHNPDLHYTGIDPFLPNYDKKDPFSRDVQSLFPSGSPEESMNRLHAAVLNQLDSWGERAVLIRETSQSAAQSFAPNSVDMVFVDANHTFDAAYSDIKTWFSKLRKGGVLLGDDWNWPEVQKAAIRFNNECGSNLFLLGSPDNDHKSFVLLRQE
jgi:predicted O-methyltransferase YrrM